MKTPSRSRKIIRYQLLPWKYPLSLVPTRFAEVNDKTNHRNRSIDLLSPLPHPRPSSNMSASSLLRVAARGSTSSFFRANTVVVRQTPLAARAGLAVPSLLAATNFSTSARLWSGEHAEETFEEFTAR